MFSIQAPTVQWGLEYQTFKLDFRMVQTIWNQNKMAAILFKTIQNPNKTIQNLNKMAAFLFKTIPKPNTIWKPNAIDHSKSERVGF